MKQTIFFVLIIIVTFGGNTLCAQKKIELGATLAFQSPKFLNESIADLSSPKKFRVRPAIGGFAKYYVGNHFFIEYCLSYSFEGGGFEQRKVNLDFVRNELFLGYTTSLDRNNSFSLKFAYAYCFLTNAKLIDKHENNKTDIKKYITPYYSCFPVQFAYKRNIKNNFSLNVNIGIQLISKTLGVNTILYFGQAVVPKFELGISKFIK